MKPRFAFASITLFLSLSMLILLPLSSCKKADDSPVQPSATTPPTTEQKIAGYYWRCDSTDVFHYINGNATGYDHPHLSMSYLHLATNHSYTWDSSPLSSSGAWAVTDETHLRLDATIYDIQLLFDHVMNLHGEHTWTSGPDVYTDKMYLYFSK